MTDLRALKKTWEALAKEDPLWAILTDSSRKGNGWQPADFFETGCREIRTVLDYLERLGLAADFSGKALDFGCGAGRLTQALSAFFNQTVGVDISAGMVGLADSYNRFPDSCRYVCNGSNTLPFEDDEFSFIYSSIVLQHIEPRYSLKYIVEFVRVLKPGGILIFQAADKRKGQYFRRIAGPVRRRLRQMSAAAGLAKELFEVHCLSGTQIEKALEGGRAQIRNMQYTNSTSSDFNGNLRYLSGEPEFGFVSKQYCLVKE